MGFATYRDALFKYYNLRRDTVLNNDKYTTRFRCKGIKKLRIEGSDIGSSTLGRTYKGENLKNVKIWGSYLRKLPGFEF